MSGKKLKINSLIDFSCLFIDTLESDWYYTIYIYIYIYISIPHVQHTSHQNFFFRIYFWEMNFLNFSWYIIQCTFLNFLLHFCRIILHMIYRHSYTNILQKLFWLKFEFGYNTQHIAWICFSSTEAMCDT